MADTNSINNSNKLDFLDKRYLGFGLPNNNNSLNIYNVKSYGAKGDGTTDDTTAIQTALSALTNTSTSGSLYFPTGTYKVSSSARKDTSVSVSGVTFTDSSCVAADVGSYVVGAGINGRVPQILTVKPGVSFTVDIAPAGSPTTIYVVKPAIVLPEGVALIGAGATYTSNGFGSGNASSSKILDGGTGITCLIRGNGAANGNASSRYKIQDLSIWGNNNSTLYGVYVGNMAWFLTVENCDISFHGTAGVALDGNMNSDDFRNTIFYGNGTVGATGYTGGVLTNIFWNQPSEAVNFYNCFFNSNYGFGVANAQGSGSYAVHLFGCQANNTLATSLSNSGASFYIATVANGNATIHGGWSESAALYDVISNGPVIIEGFHFYSANIAYGWDVFGSGVCIGCWFANHTTAGAKIESGGNISWISVNVSDSFFFSGCPGNGSLFGVGSSTVLAGAGGGISPGSFGQATGNNVWQGTGAPSDSNGGNGDFYLRTDGSTNTHIYFKSSGSWTGII